tara:strand:- start:2966 stop:3820 length:855 start_codon:yes stop_codon:yes gene_type:complete
MEHKKQYTLQQWSAIQGGHEMPETSKSQYSFIGDILESKMFRSKSRVEGSNARDMADFAMMNMLALYILSNEYDFAPVAQDYAKRTIMYGNFNSFRAGGTDLNIALTAVRNGMADSGDKNKLQSDKLEFNDVKIKAFLNTMKAGRPPASIQSFFMRLEKDLDIQNSNYRSIRRLVQDWPRLNKMQKQLVITRMLQFFRTKALRSELYSYIRDMSRSQGLEAKNAHNAEQPRMRGSDTLAKIAMATGAIAGGYALGKSIGSGISGMDKFAGMRQKLTTKDYSGSN